MSLHFFVLSRISLFIRSLIGVLETSWVFYPPLSSISLGTSLELMVFSLHLNGVSSLLGSFNYFCTFFNVGLGNFEVYLFSLLTTSILLVFGLPSVIICLSMVVIDRNLSTYFFDFTEGGRLLLYIHLFWWFGHPEVYVVALPAFGLVSNLISIYTPFSRYYEAIYSIIIISFIGLSVWAHHIFLDIDWDSRLFFSYISLLVGLPTGNKVFTWLYTLSCFSFPIVCDFPVYLTLVFIRIFSFGGFTGLILGRVGLRYFLHDTYYVVAHFHYVISLSASVGSNLGLATLLSARSFMRLLSRSNHSASILLFLSSNFTFMPIHFLGFYSIPRRYSDYTVALSSFNWVRSLGSLLGCFSYSVRLASYLMVFVLIFYRC